MKAYSCLRCNTEMSFLSSEKIQLGQTGLFLGDLPNLLAGALQVDIYICPNCNKVEFFLSDEDIFIEDTPQKQCPNCGTLHDFDCPKCPRCKYDYYAK